MKALRPKRLPDDEFEERTKRNLERLHDTPSGPEISRGGDALGELLDDLDSIFDEATPDDAAPNSEGIEDEAQTVRREVIRDAAWRYGPNGEIGRAEYEKFAEALAADERRRYRARIKKEEGRDVRRILLDPEARAARRAELERKRYAKKVGGVVRRYNKLDDMTDEERAAYKREQARIRQRKRRDALKMKRDEE